MPPRVLKQITKLAEQRGETPEQIVEKAVKLFADTEKRVGELKDKDILADPAARSVFNAYMQAARKKADATKTPEQRSAAGYAGAAGRAKKLTPEARKKIAADAAKARWKKKAADETADG